MNDLLLLFCLPLERSLFLSVHNLETAPARVAFLYLHNRDCQYILAYHFTPSCNDQDLLYLDQNNSSDQITWDREHIYRKLMAIIITIWHSIQDTLINNSNSTCPQQFLRSHTVLHSQPQNIHVCPSNDQFVQTTFLRKLDCSVSQNYS